MKKKYTIVLAVVIGVIGVYIISDAVVERRMASAQSRIADHYTAHVSQIKNLVALSQDGGGSAVARSIISECPSYKQTRYDELLSTLSVSTTKAALAELTDVFEDCASVPLLKRRISNRELEIYVDQLAVLTSEYAMYVDQVDLYNDLEKWRKLVESEQVFNDLYQELISTQGQIIALVSSASSNEEIRSVRENAAVLQARQSSVREEIRLLREELLGA